MKIIKYVFFTKLLLLMVFFPLQAQNTQGTEFWLTFGQISQLPPYLIDTQIRIVGGEDSASGRIHFTKLGTYFDFSIEPYDVINYVLNDTEKNAVYNLSTGTTNNSVFISSNNPISVYAFNQREQYAEATNILPVSALGKDYYQVSFLPWNSPTTADAYGVVATQNNTQLFHDKTFITTLNAGEVYYRTSTTDMTGIFVNASNPVAFFSLCRFTAVPPDNIAGYFLQQLAPVNTWGKTFFVPVSIFESEIVRIVVAHNGTNINQTGGTIRTASGGQPILTGLQAGQFVELEIDLINRGCFIETDAPVGVCSFMRSGLWGIIPWSVPSMTWIPGIEQSVSKALIAPFIPSTPSRLLFHYALIITPSVTKNNTKVSIGNASPEGVSGGTWYDNYAAGMSFYSMPLTEISTSYYFTNSEGVILLGYGIGGGSPATYYYLAYSAMRDLEATFYANEIPYQLLKGNSICAGTVDFQAEIEGLHPTHPERLTWWINGVEYLPAKNLDNWSKSFSVGEYEIEMKVRYENDETTSKTGTLIIKSCNQSATFYKNNVPYDSDTTFCNKNVNFRAEIEGLHPTHPERIKWYVDGIEETSALNLTEWGRPFENGTYEIKMVVRYDNDETATRIGTLKVQALWIKMRNIRY